MIKIQRPTGNIKLELPHKKYLYIYSFYNKKNGKCYIGSTNNVERRITEHLDGLGSPYLLQDLVEYGRKSFDIKIEDYIIDNDTQEDRKAIEKLEDTYIEGCDAIRTGYNLTLNRKHIKSNKVFDLNNFQIKAKYAFIKNNAYVFTVGGYTLYYEYEDCMKLSEDIPKIQLKSKAGYKYYSLSVNFEDSINFEINSVYNLHLQYDTDNGLLSLINFEPC